MTTGAPRQTRFDLTCMGESMLRFSTPLNEYFTAARHFDVHVGGAESNVASIFARLGHSTGWMSALPDNDLGRMIVSRLSESGVDTSGVRMVEDGRVGLYFLDSSPPPKNTSVTYDRAGSVFSDFAITDHELEYLLDTKIVHLTGITPSLGPIPRASFEHTLTEAKTRNVTISFDVNYRERLWSIRDARPVIVAALTRAHIVFCSLRDVNRLFGRAEDGPAAVSLLQEHTGAGWIVVSMGERGVHARGPDGDASSPAVPTTVIDRPGAGDALAAGVLDGYLDNHLHDGLRRGTLLASICLSHRGDMVLTNRRELMAALTSHRTEIRR